MKRGTKGAWGVEFDTVETYVGANVRRYRVARDLTQEKLAQLVGIEVKSLQRIESGFGNVTARVLASLAANLNVTIEAMFVPAQLEPRKRGRPRQVQRPLTSDES